MEKKILYFTKHGPENTEKTIELAKERAKELGIRDIVVASSHGGTGMKVINSFKGMDVNIVAVAICASFKKEGWVMSDHQRRKLEEEGARVLICPHALSAGVEEAFVDKHGARGIVANTLYRFSQGMKVCVEIALMAADAGLIDVDREVLAIAGTSEGADTCIALKPSYSRKFFDLKVKEIVAMPR
jgi:hypothetical protein